MKKTNNYSTEFIQDFESNLGLPHSFFTRLVEEDDWSFVIKIHALMEASFTHLLSETISISMKGYSNNPVNSESLSRVLAWLELSNKRAGKLTLADALALTTDPHRKLVAKLSELRNDLVHDVRNVNFKFPQYVAGLDTNQKRNLIEAFGFGPDSKSKTDLVLQHTKLAIWCSVFLSLSHTWESIEAFKNRREASEIKDQLLKVLKLKETILQKMLAVKRLQRSG